MRENPKYYAIKTILYEFSLSLQREQDNYRARVRKV